MQLDAFVPTVQANCVTTGAGTVMIAGSITSIVAAGQPRPDQPSQCTYQLEGYQIR
jgi:hypothetical protein